ncbi:hypothetical protein R5R35_013608 [Gryllus longicercus]|uniref:Integrin alpha-2 domain-containing protein n=1 Tax=Gryllus longicercus TaxID=2509291 RepID=A0AAN9VKZ6_9ORTH
MVRSGRTVRCAAVVLAAVFSATALLCSLCPCVDAFNVDVDHIVRYSGRGADDMFGFSVALHKESQSGESWVLVGAPQAQSEWQRSVHRGGAVYRCHVASSQCAQVPFDQSDGNNRNVTRHDIDNKSRQWFGATVAAAQSGAAVVACAPRYVYYPNTREERHDPVGTCWVAQERFARFNEYSPCRTSEWGYHRKGHCQAGLGASISKDGSQLFIGAPGSHYWQGQLFVENLHRRPDVFETPEGPSTDDDTYLGYSVAVGYFEGPEGNTTVAVGRPRGDHLQGKVEIYTWDLLQIVDISGDQLGGYFGYSLCASDMDGDGKDDLVVGAPLYTERNNEGKYETGRIYVFYQRGDYERNNSRDGINSRSRFGLSVASLGDINRDGYGDIAVGAPYDSPEGRGAVYIYLGSSEGIRVKPSQVIHAKDVSQSLSTFGFSLSGGLDLDNNFYPDLVVGAYESNSAAFFRARPIVKVNATVEFINTNKQINLKNHNCKVQGPDNNAICFGVSSCIIFDGLGVDNGHEFNITITLDAAKPRSSRMFFRDSPQKNSMNFNAWAVKNTMYCRPFNVYIKSNIRDKLTPLEVEMRYSLLSPRVQTRSLTPVLDLVRPPVKKDTLHIAKNCGPDNICIPDLKMKVEPSVEEYFLGSGEDFKLRVLVENKREDAFEATYSLKIPQGLNYKNIARLDENKDVTIQCSPPTTASNNTLLCDIGNPLSSKKHVEFEVLMQPSYAEGLRSYYDFEMEVNSTNPEKEITKDDNKIMFKIPINIQTDLSVMGASFPSDVHWNSIDYSKTEGFKEEAEIGPQVVHVHKIRNNGRVNIVKAEVYLVVPTSTFADDNILYLLEQPETKGSIKCDAIEANLLSLKLENRRVSYLDGQERLTGSVEQSASKESSSSSTSAQSGSSSSQGQRSRGSLHEDDAPSEGGRRGGSASQQETYHGHGGTHRLVGVDEERVIHKDEGLENSGRGTFGQTGSGYFQQSSHSFQNKSRTSQHVETQSGSSGPVVHKSTNYSASWSKDGGPLHHYENHTSESGGQVQTSETHHNGRGQGVIEHHSTGGRTGGGVEYESRTHYSSSSGSQSGQAERGQGAVVHHSDRGQTGGSAESESRTHYSTSSRSQSGQAERGQGAVVHHSDRGQTGGSAESGSRTHYSSSSGSQSGQAERGQGVVDHHSAGGRTGGSAEYESRTHYSSSSRSQSGQVERGHSDTSGSNQTSGTYSSGGSYRDNTNIYRDNTGESRYNARDHSDREGRYDNTGYRDNKDYRNYGQAVGSHTSQSGHQETGDGYHESTGYYDRDYHDNEDYESERDYYDRRQDSGRTQGQNSSHGVFRHSWSISGSSNSNAGHGTQWSSGRDNVGRDNVDENERHVDGQYGTLDHRSRERTHQYGDNDYNAGEASHSSSNHHRTSSSHQQSSSGWSQSGTSHTYDQNYRGGGYGDDSSSDANVHQHLASNWNSEQSQGRAGQSQGSDHYNSGRAAATGRDQRINKPGGQASRGSGQFYTSSVLLGDGGEVDLGYAARGYGQQHGSSSSSSSRHYANEEHRRTTVDPDLADLGAQFTKQPEGNQRHGSHRGEDEEGQLRLYGRYRRSVPDSSVQELLKCNATNCTRIHCTLGPLTEGQDALIALRMRVWVPTMKKLKDNRIIKTSSRMVLQVTELPHIGTPHEPIVRDHEVFTDIVSTDSPTIPDIVPLWVVVLSAVAGTIILLLLIFLLWKCGFFKRNRPADAAEKEPLNRNGHYSAGDEAL